MKRHSRLVALVAVLALFLTACGGSGDPESYSDQLNDDGQSLVEANFIEACLEAGTARPELSSDIQTICTCSYDSISSTVPFDEFKSLDDALRDDPSSTFPEDISSLIADCIRENSAVS